MNTSLASNFAPLEKLDPAERSAYLDSACTGDAEQRKRIEGLLAALNKAGRCM